MKLVRFGNEGSEKPGMIDSNGNLRDLSAHVADINPATMGDIERLKGLNENDLPLVDGNPRLGGCVGNIGKYMCIGLNYSDHAEESGLPVPDHPILFMKATSAVVGPNDDVSLPRGSEKGLSLIHI